MVEAPTRRGGRGGLRAAGRPRAPRARLSGPPPRPSTLTRLHVRNRRIRGRSALRELLLAGLEKLEYRGYDSAGLSVLADGEVDSVRAVGNLANLRAAVDERRRQRRRRRCRRRDDRHRPHPLGDPRPRHRGERPPPRRQLRPASTSSSTGSSRTTPSCAGACRTKGQDFTSETDAEVVAHLIASHYDGDLAAAVRAAFAELRGHYAFVAMHADEPQRLVGARKECPLVAGVGEGETFLASAIPAFLADTRTAMPIENGEIVEIEAGAVADHRRRGQPDRARDRRGHLGRRRRREGRLRDLHAEGDPRTGRRGRRDDHRPPARRRRRRPLRRRALRRAACAACGGS